MRRNLTLAIDEEVLRRARVVAAQRKRSLAAIVRDYLCGLAREDRERRAALRRLRRMMNSKPLEDGPRRWRREELHER